MDLKVDVSIQKRTNVDPSIPEESIHHALKIYSVLQIALGSILLAAIWQPDSSLSS